MLRPHYSARLRHSGSRGPSEFFFPQVCHRNALTKIAWEDAVQGLGMAMSTVVSKTEKGNCCLSATCFANSDISARCFTSIYGKNVVVRVSGGNGA